MGLVQRSLNPKLSLSESVIISVLSLLCALCASSELRRAGERHFSFLFSYLRAFVIILGLSFTGH
jgi:hypothetical protein